MLVIAMVHCRLDYSNAMLVAMVFQLENGAAAAKPPPPVI